MESAGEAYTDAPPKQVALAMERLASAARKITDIRLGAGRLFEALFLAIEGPQQSSNKIAQLILREETSMRQHFQDLSRLALDLLPHTLFSKACSKCGRLLMIDKSLALFLPPVHHAIGKSPEPILAGQNWLKLWLTNQFLLIVLGAQLVTAEKINTVQQCSSCYVPIVDPLCHF